MQISSVSVRKLFGIFNHEISLIHADRVTIIHGPNGYGKTVMLRMIAAVAESRRGIFEQIPFEEFCLTLKDGSARIVRRSVESATEPGAKRRVKLEFLVRQPDGELSLAVPSTASAEIPRPLLMKMDREIPSPYRLFGNGWRDDSGRTYTLSEIIELFPNAAEVLPRKYRPGMLFDISQDLEIFFVETNRLSSNEAKRSRAAYYSPDEPERSPLPRVKFYSDDIVQRIRTVLTDYARHSQESDRTFPERLVRFVRDRHSALSEREIITRMDELEEKRKRLISLGLLDSESGLHDLSEEDVRSAPEALTIYVEDTAKKMAVFQDLERRIGALMDIINARFTYKKLRVTRDFGFRIVNDVRDTIALNALSSGEQHELVVLYELLFRGPLSGLVLVDEPEISLHVAWQSRFLSDLIRILTLTDSYAIVATHSPVIIGTRSDLAIELSGPETVTHE